MSIKGELSQIKLADILQMVALNGQEGTLIVSDKDSKKWLYFSKEGVSLLSSGKRQPLSLGQRLLSAGKVNRTQLDEAVLEYRKTGKKLGQILVDQGLVCKEEVEEAVRAQIADEIFDLLEWEGAEFEFVPGPPLEKSAATQPVGRHLSFDVNTILLEAAKRADEWDLVKKKINSLNEVLVPCVLYKTQLDLSAELAAAFALVDGRTSVREIIQKLRMPRLDAAVLLGVLLETGTVRFATKEELCRLAQSPMLGGNHPQQAELYELALQRKDDMQTRQHWAEALERAGRREESANQYKLIAAAHLAQGDVHAGADFLRHVVRLMANDRESRERLIEILLHLRSPIQASIQIRRLAQIYAEEGHVEKALEEYRRLLKLTPEDFEAQKQILELLVRQDRIEEAFSEAEVLEQYARTANEHDQVIKFFGRLVATRPGFTAAQKKLERISRQERRKIKMRRLSRRALILGGVAAAALAFMAGYEWLAWTSYRPAWVESEKLARQGNYQGAIGVLRDKLSSFAYSNAHRSATVRIRDLLQQQAEDEKTRRAKISHTVQEAEEKEKKGDYKGAAEALVWLSREMERENPLASFDLKLKARGLMEKWNWAVQMLERVKALDKNVSECREAHSDVSRLCKMYPETAAFLNARLPVLITSTPPGAEVAADERGVGKTPVIVYKTPKKALSVTLTDADGRKLAKTIDSDTDWQVNISPGEPKP